MTQQERNNLLNVMRLLVFIASWIFATIVFATTLIGWTPNDEATLIIALLAVTMIGVSYEYA